MTKKQLTYNQMFQLIYSETNKKIRVFFNQNNNFSGESEEKISHIIDKRPIKKLTFFKVLHKYYLVVSLGRYVFPIKHLFKILYLILLLNVRKMKISLLLEKYNSFIDKKLTSAQQLVPQIDFNIKKHLILKLVLANVLLAFVSSKLLNHKHLLANLEKAFYKGFYVGITYVISDIVLDTKIFDNKQKRAFHEFALKNLISENVEIENSTGLLKLMSEISGEFHQLFPFNENEYIYQLLYFLEKVQYDEINYKVNPNDIDSIIHKCSLVAMKVHFSLLSVQHNMSKELLDTIQESIIWSFYCQLTDDLRDITEDMENNIETLFTIKFDNNIFNPMNLYIFLVHKFSSKYYAKWMYDDLLQLMLDTKMKSKIHQDERKIHIFIGKLTRGEIKL